MNVIWDFNGTILDDVQLCVDCCNRLTAEYGLPPVGGADRYRELFCFPVIDYYRKLGFDFDRIPYEIPANHWVEFYLENEHTAPIREGVAETLEEIRRRGHFQAVLSASEENMLRGQLERLGALDYFDEIYGRNDVYAGGKPELAGKWLLRHAGEESVLIGDTLHDAECAEIIGCHCVLVRGGHVLLDGDYGPGVTVVDSPSGIIPAIEEKFASFSANG
ncbi:MAG: HAD hydrolase-like protein [Clostridia bacterium]|nr:HAD hydrolase-like protein [Clostridia bacterium]